MEWGKLPPPPLPLYLPLTVQLRHIDLDLWNELPLTFKPTALVCTTSEISLSNNYFHITTKQNMWCQSETSLISLFLLATSLFLRGSLCFLGFDGI